MANNLLPQSEKTVGFSDAYISAQQLRLAELSTAEALHWNKWKANKDNLALAAIEKIADERREILSHVLPSGARFIVIVFDEGRTQERSTAVWGPFDFETAQQLALKLVARDSVVSVKVRIAG